MTPFQELPVKVRFYLMKNSKTSLDNLNSLSTDTLKEVFRKTFMGSAKTIKNY